MDVDNIPPEAYSQSQDVTRRTRIFPAAKLPMSKSPRLLPAQDLGRLLRRAREARGKLVPAVMVGSAHCPWCELITKEQLLPRMASSLEPSLVVLDFDLGDHQPLPTLENLPPAGQRNFSPAAWARHHRYQLAPTVVCLDRQGRPLGEPLVGYSSRDFYGAYLEDRIRLAQAHWRQ
jgi:hypothetical protein